MQTDGVRRQVGQHLPLRRIEQAEEMAGHAVGWLASPAPGFVTGSVLGIDGGKHT